jgi:hypothetical protein
MSLRHHVPADDEAQSVAELSADCACLSALQPSHPLPAPAHWQPHPVRIPDETRKLVDGMSDYGGVSDFAS